MSRRKSLTKREPNGRPQRHPPDLPSPAEVHRLRDAALAGLRDPVWATTIGRLFLTGQISGAQFAAGKRWADLAQAYSQATQAPRAPRSAKLAPEGGTPPDPDSAKGRREARQQLETVQAYLDALKVLRSIGAVPHMAVVATCEQNQHPPGTFALAALRGGLSALVAFWGSKK